MKTRIAKFSDLLMKTLTIIDGMEPESDEINFITSEGRKYIMNHTQDCCESVFVQDVCGDVSDLLNSPILQAEESISSDETPVGMVVPGDSYTWTFYKLSTIKGSVTIRWLGESSGYYSESVDFEEII